MTSNGDPRRFNQARRPKFLFSGLTKCAQCGGREIRKLIQAIKDGVSALSIKDELLSLEARKAELQSRLDASEMPELLHPRMADVYREKVANLGLALDSEESRSGAKRRSGR